MPASLEVELKLRADDDGPLQQLAELAALGPCRLGPPYEVEELDRYLDTDDGRLSAARWACRLRSREGSTRVSLKGPALHAPGDAVHRRPELEGPATDSLHPTAWPPSEARDRLRELAGDAPLAEWLVLLQRRVERSVEDETRVAVLSLDRVSVSRDGEPLGAFAIVELELAAEAGEALLPQLADALGAIPGLRPEPLTKLERALALLPAIR